tara:strand:+ start:345 stop:1658 length:1314 start_codon:yes stop_codon:yes gene_type:complete
MNYLQISQFKQKSILDYGLLLFFVGIFFLPSSLFLGILFLLPAAIIGSIIKRKNYFKDKWNYPFFIFGFFILINTFLQNFILKNNYSEIWDPILSFAGMGNWLPFIWFFWAFQPYLNSKSRRRLLSLVLIAGTLPVLITGFGQFFFNWTGPFKTFYSLIIWYQRPIENPGGLSGLFSHQNYAGSWLNIVWPFCIAFLLEKSKDIFQRTFSIGFFISVGFAAFLTYSRNTWLGLLITLPIMLGRKSLRTFLALFTIFLSTLFFIFSNLFAGKVQDIFKSFFPERLLLEFASEGYKGLDVTRLEIFSSAINLIKSNPFVGIGAASFTEIYQLETTYWKGHSHNLLIELALSYGLITSIIFFMTITIMIFLSARVIFFSQQINNISYFERAFWTSLFFFLISQLFDIQYFDGRISLITWILIAGLKNIIEENQFRNKVTS